MDKNRQTIMLVGTGSAYRDVLAREYELLEATVPQARELMRSRRDDIALALVCADYNGMTLLRDMNRFHWIDDVPVIACGCADCDAGQLCQLHIADVLGNEPEAVVLRRVDNVIRLFAKQRRLLALLTDQDRIQSSRDQQLRHVDDVTACLNFEGFRERVLLLLDQYPGNHYALWFCDIKNFKYINESFGFETGNRLLRFWSETILYELREDEAFGRLSGDTMLLMTRFWDMERLRKRFENIAGRVASYLHQPERSYQVQMAVGIYLLQPDDLKQVTIEQMIDRANVAQKSVKRLSGSRLAVFNEEYWEEKWRDMELNQRLGEAIERGEITVWYQPQYDYINEQIIGAEALCRWEHGTIGSIRPSVFIPILERSGQITRLDRYVWERVCADMRHWKDNGTLGNVELSVNISRTDLEELDSVGDTLMEILERHGMGERKLRLEITESAYMNEPEKLAASVKELQELGFTIEMDDFGSGFSSLNMLQDVPVDVLKLDMHFLAGKGEQPRGGKILNSVIRMANELNLPTIAEGVETLEQANLLKNLGCNLMQGYYFARPMPAEEFEELLAMQRTGADNRIFHRSRGADKIADLLDADSASAYIFDSCIGPAMLLEYDGNNVEATLINDAAYQTIGLPRSRLEGYRTDFLATLRPEDRRFAERAIRRAISVGSERVELFNRLTERWFSVRLQAAASNEKRNVLLALFEDVDQAYRDRAEMARVKNAMESYMMLLPGGMFKYDASDEQKFTYVSETVLDMLGYTREEFDRKFHNHFPEMIYHEDRARVLREIDEQIANGDTDYCEYRIETADGSLKWVYDRGRCITNEDGKKWFYVVIADVDDQKQHLKAREWRDEKYKMLAQIPGTVTYDYDPKKDVLTVEVTMEDGRVEPRVIRNLLSANDPCPWMPDDSRVRCQEVFRPALESPRRGDLDLQIRSLRSGASRWYRAVFRSLPDENNRVYRIVGRADDFDDDIRSRREWEERAQHDAMTGLLNHETLKKRVAEGLVDADGGAVLMIDIDDFKIVNDTLGHLRGDSVLKKTADVLRATFREEDILGRFGGDEFVVFMPGLKDVARVEEMAEKLLQAIRDIRIKGVSRLSCSVGIGIAENGQLTLRQTLERADVACYHAKDNGKARCTTYSRKMHASGKLIDRHTPTDARGASRTE